MIGVWWLQSKLTLKNLLLSMSGKSFGTGYAFSFFVIGWFQAFSLHSGHFEHFFCAFQGNIKCIEWCTEHARYCGCKIVDCID